MLEIKIEDPSMVYLIKDHRALLYSMTTIAGYAIDSLKLYEDSAG
jgi:hypothetical protein